ncbi:MAG: N-acetylmuramoyl-L-alanine amidase, partial [Acidobacteriota bacterium]
MPRGRIARVLALAWAMLLASGSASGENAVGDENAGALVVDQGIGVRLHEGRDIVLLADPEKGEGYLSLARRLCGDERHAPALEAANRGLPVILGREVEVPWDLLRDEYRYLALRVLFPEDRYRDGTYEHRPESCADLNYGEGLWQVALWFTGKGENWDEIAADNGLTGPDLPRGRAIRVRRALLRPEFEPPTSGANGLLRYGRDQRGEFAVYELKKGEALYSAVVLRFTGLVEREDVTAAVDEIAERSEISDLRDLPVGFRVKIPLDLLDTPFLPENHRRRVLARVRADELASVVVPRRPRSLDGVHVILDPGHGGADLGTRNHRIWESDYVYDTACRVARLLESETGARVHLTVTDPEYGCRVFDRDKLIANKKEQIATHPPHAIRGGRSTTVSVNLRWYLANAIYRSLTRDEGVSPENIVFLSLHADSRHRSLRGGMVYIPGERYRRGTHAMNSSAPYRKYREWKAAPKVTFSRKERLRDEVVSRKLATALLEGYEHEQLPIHLNRPVRDHIVRAGRRGRRRRWVPAVLRGNAVPAKLL